MLHIYRAPSILQTATSTKATLSMEFSKELGDTTLMVVSTKVTGKVDATMVKGTCCSLMVAAIKGNSWMELPMEKAKKRVQKVWYDEGIGRMEDRDSPAQ